jgi:3-isopropylmalate/(R)-2-methylmalate dehydratase large subunit
MSPSTLFDKVWDAHVVERFDDDWALLHIDRHLLHDFSGPSALAELRSRGLRVHAPALAFATPDHLVSSATDRTIDTNEFGGAMWAAVRNEADQTGIVTLEIGGGRQGIVHVTGPEQGIVLPGLTVICGDSHTCTNGGLGALAFGVGTSESAHALATQTLRQRRPKRMRILVDGALGQGVTAKDLALHLIGALGASGGVEHAIEYAGATVRALDVEARLTLCNLSVELGARSGLVAPDEVTFRYLRDRPFAPAGEDLERALDDWRTLAGDDEAEFDRDVAIDAAAVAPTVTWGTSPEHAIAIDGLIPDPATSSDTAQRQAISAALGYMGLEAARPLAGTPVDWVFIGSCANARLSDLRAAAAVAKDRHVAEGVTAWVVPGSWQVKQQAEAEGLDRVFRAAGFQWREPGCSMCVAANGEQIPPGARVVSTSNRNFVGRQGPGARTHLASPAMAVAAAVRGQITDVRRL